MLAQEDLFNKIGVGIAVTDSEFNVEFINDYLKNLIAKVGYVDQLMEIGLAQLEIFLRNVIGHVPEKFVEFTGEFFGPEKILQVEGSAYAIQDATGGSEQILVTLKDLTDHSSLMSAALIHEIKNPLSAIKGFIQLFATKYPEERSFSALVLEQIERINKLIGESGSAFGMWDFHGIPTDVNLLVKKLGLLYSSDCERKGLTLTMHLTDGLPFVCMDSDLMSSALTNLIINAIDAMPTGGTLNLETEYLPADNLVKIVFRDSGKGIRVSDLQKMFSPCFSTKGKTSGLGLFVAYEIVKLHKGRIEVETFQGKGSCFCVLLPAMTDLCRPIETSMSSDVERVEKAV